MYIHGLWEWRPTNGRPRLCVAVWWRVQDRMRGLGLQLIGCMPVVPVTHSADAAAVCGSWHYTGVICLWICLLTSRTTAQCQSVFNSDDYNQVSIGPWGHSAKLAKIMSDRVVMKNFSRRVIKRRNHIWNRTNALSVSKEFEKQGCSFFIKHR